MHLCPTEWPGIEVQNAKGAADLPRLYQFKLSCSGRMAAYGQGAS